MCLGKRCIGDNNVRNRPNYDESQALLGSREST